MWAEKPIPFQGYFALERLENLSITNPNLTQQLPFKEFLQGNITALKQQMNEKDAMVIMTVTLRLNSIIWLVTGPNLPGTLKQIDFL
jgi:hypothetical protein